MAANIAIGLAAAIEALREELLLALDAGKESRMRFRLAPIELSLQVAVTKEGDGKIGWKVLALGSSYEKVTTQVLTLKLDPAWMKDDGSFTDDFMIGDQSEPTSFGPKH